MEGKGRAPISVRSVPGSLTTPAAWPPCAHMWGVNAHLLTAAALASPAHCGDWLHHPVIHIVKISWALAVGLVGKVGEINVARLQGFVA